MTSRAILAIETSCDETAVAILRPGELLETFRDLTVKGFEEGSVGEPKPAMIQRLCAMRRGKR